MADLVSGSTEGRIPLLYSKFHLALFATLSLIVALPGTAQNVAYTGKLHIGFGDQGNTLPTLQTSNNAIPICAGYPPSNPASTQPAGTTAGTLIVNGRANQVGSGPGAALTFSALDGSTGGAQEFDFENCSVFVPGFANPRWRSRTQFGSAHWPGRKGLYTPNIGSQPVSARPTATYMLSAGGGNTFAGTTLSTSLPFSGNWTGQERIVKGPANYGGGVPYSGSAGTQLGINFTGGIGHTSGAPSDYGSRLYPNGFIPNGPFFFGTDFKGNQLWQASPSNVTPTPFPNGLLAGGTPIHTFAARTPGGTTQHQHGAIRTIGGGNTVTPAASVVVPPGLGVPTGTYDCIAMIPGPCPPIVSHVVASNAAFEWTTGTVTHTDMIGDWTTIRTAMGFDTPTSTPAGATRHLQLVTPWAASIRVVGPFGLQALLPNRGIGGVAVLDIMIVPVPEPDAVALLGPGSIGLMLLGVAGRHRRVGIMPGANLSPPLST